MQKFMESDAGPWLLLIAVGLIVLSVMMVIAVLAIPKIAKYHRATMKLTALMAKKAGVDGEVIVSVLHDQSFRDDPTRYITFCNSKKKK